MFQNELQKYLIEKMNLNTAGLTFNGDYLFNFDNGTFKIETQIEGTYRIEETQYIPTQITDWRTTVQPYASIDLQDVVVPFTFAFRESQLDGIMIAIDEFRSLLNGTEDTIDGLNVGFRIGQPTQPSGVIDHGGNSWIIISISVMLSAGIGLSYGNNALTNFKMALTGETLVSLIATSIAIDVSNETNVNSPDGITTVKNNKSTQVLTIDIIYQNNTLCNKLLDYAWQDITYKQEFDISVPYSDTITKTGTYVITSCQTAINYGTPTGFKLTLYRAE